MSQSPTADSFTANQMAKSIIISRSGERPSFLNLDKFKSVPYPTPAMLTYDRVVSHNFSKFYWSQEPRKRLVLCVAVCRELFHEGRFEILLVVTYWFQFPWRNFVPSFRNVYSTYDILHEHQTTILTSHMNLKISLKERRSWLNPLLV